MADEPCQYCDGSGNIEVKNDLLRVLPCPCTRAADPRGDDAAKWKAAAEGWEETCRTLNRTATDELKQRDEMLREAVLVVRSAMACVKLLAPHPAAIDGIASDFLARAEAVGVGG